MILAAYAVSRKPRSLLLDLMTNQGSPMFHEATLTCERTKVTLVLGVLLLEGGRQVGVEGVGEKPTPYAAL